MTFETQCNNAFANNHETNSKVRRRSIKGAGSGMMTKLRPIAFLPLALLLACGGSPDGAEQSTASAQTSAAQTSAAKTPAAQTPAAQSSVLREDREVEEIPGGVVPDDYIHVPGGMLMHKSCVYEIPNGSRLSPDLPVRNHDGSAPAQFEPCKYPAYRTREHGSPHIENSTGVDPSTNGWIASTQQFVPGGLDSWRFIVAAVTVPPPPFDPGATIFYFNGLSPQNSSFQILQPVLQWGFSAAGGWFNWEIASWECFYNGSGVCAHTPLTDVNVGDSIVMSVYLGSVSQGCAFEWAPGGAFGGLAYECGNIWEYTVTAFDQNTNAMQQGVFSNVDVGPDVPPNGTLFPWAFPAVYESYGDADCENGLQFRNIQLIATPKSLPLGWTPVAYQGNTGPSNGDTGNPSCFNGQITNGTTTSVY
jgi:hypothetical protein